MVSGAQFGCWATEQFHGCKKGSDVAFTNMQLLTKINHHVAVVKYVWSNLNPEQFCEKKKKHKKRNKSKNGQNCYQLEVGITKE